MTIYIVYQKYKDVDELKRYQAMRPVPFQPTSTQVELGYYEGTSDSAKEQAAAEWNVPTELLFAHLVKR